MRIMIIVLSLMVASVLSIAAIGPAGSGVTGDGNKIEASVDQPAPQ